MMLYDNACVKSFHEAFKKEEVYRKTYMDFETALLYLFTILSCGTTENEFTEQSII